MRASQSGSSFSSSRLTMASASMEPLNCSSWKQAMQCSSCLVSAATCCEGLGVGSTARSCGLLDTATAWNCGTEHRGQLGRRPGHAAPGQWLHTQGSSSLTLEVIPTPWGRTGRLDPPKLGAAFLVGPAWAPGSRALQKAFTSTLLSPLHMWHSEVQDKLLKQGAKIKFHREPQNTSLDLLSCVDLALGRAGLQQAWIHTHSPPLGLSPRLHSLFPCCLVSSFEENHWQ